MQLCSEGAAGLLGALGATDIGRDDAELFMAQHPCEVLDEERHRLEIG
jgi:hypothetical protein